VVERVHAKSLLLKVAVRFVMRLVFKAFDSWHREATILAHWRTLVMRCLARMSHLVLIHVYLS
jgi:hypothetical protein